MCSDWHSQVSTKYRASLHCVVFHSSSDKASIQKLQILKWKLDTFSKRGEFQDITLQGFCISVVYCILGSVM